MRQRPRRACDRSFLSQHQQTKETHSHAQAGHDENSSRILRAWQTSRHTTIAGDSTGKAQSPSPTLFLRSGVPRKLTVQNFRIAAFLLSQCWLDVANIVLSLHPIRMPLMILFTLVQGALPAYQTYSQATILDEVRRIASMLFPPRQPTDFS